MTCAGKPGNAGGLLVSESWANGVRGIQLFVDGNGDASMRSKLSSDGWIDWRKLS